MFDKREVVKEEQAKPKDEIANLELSTYREWPRLSPSLEPLIFFEERTRRISNADQSS